MFWDDAPIKISEEDSLGRRRFAEALGQNLLAFQQEESVVVGLFGPWGSGKTSLVNMIVEKIASASTENAPIIIKFNPWNFSNTNELLLAFFTQVFSVVSSKSQKFKKTVGKRLKNYGKALKQAGNIPMVGTFMGSFGGFLDFAIEEDGLTGYREKLDAAFRELDRKIIIMIDDLDRLRQTEIRQMLQVVKLNANFPNTVYLLSASREIIEKSLDTEQGISGQDYLKKIVQLGFDIPPIDPSHITNILIQGINQALYEFTDADQNRWGEIYNGGFRSFFSNLRDVKRFLNGLSFNYRLVPKEVNPEDFIAIEAMRLFAPEIYAKIAENKALFTSVFTPNPEYKEQIDKIFSSNNKYGEICKSLAIKLFPGIQSLYYSGHTRFIHRNLGALKKAKRVCVSENFDAYFLLGIPAGEISHAELEQIKVAAQNEQELTILLQEIFRGNRFRRLVERVSEILNDLPSNTATKNLCNSLLDLGDQVPVEPLFFLSLETNRLLAQIIYRLLQKLEEKERFNWLKEKIASGPALYNPVRQVAISLPYLEKGEEGSLFDEKCIEELKSATVTRIEKEAESEMLLERSNLPYILQIWRNWTESDEHLLEFIDTTIAVPEKSAQFLTAFLGANTYNYQVNWVVDIKEMRDFVDPKHLLEQVEKLTPNQFSKLTSDTLLAIDSLYKILSKENNEAKEL